MTTRRFFLLSTGIILSSSLVGCGIGGSSPKPPAQPYKGLTLRIGVVGDPRILPLVDAQRAEWEEKVGAEIALLPQPLDPKTGEKTDADLIVFPGDRFGDLIDAQWLAVIPDASLRPKPIEDSGDGNGSPNASSEQKDPLDFPDILSVFRDQACKYGEDRYALPLGGSALVVVYRRDVFDNENNRKAAAKANVVLEPPKTWAQLDNLAKFFNGLDWNNDGVADHGIAMVTARDAEGVGVTTLLARAAALGQHPDQFSFLLDDDTMAPQLSAPPIVQALTDLRALEEFGPKGLTAESARAAFRDGKVALLIDRAERVSRWNDPKKPVSTGVAALPGSERVFDPDRKTYENSSPPNRPSYLPHGGGWFIAPSTKADSKGREAAIDFIKYLTSPETSARLLGDRDFPMLPTRMSQLNMGPPDPRSALGVDPQSWSKAVAESLSAARVVPGLRIPQAETFLADLAFDHGVFQSAAPEEALKIVSKSWAERIVLLGKARQLWHYRRSLNRSTMSESPPPREAP
jgi:multiple sugar transport system substrate-binding protein